MNTTRFRTLSGSVYEVREDGRRTFRRAGPEPEGPRPQWSELTVYVEPRWAFWLELHLQCGCRLLPSCESPRRLCLWTPAVEFGAFPQHPVPARRLHPVELFPRGWHVGHTIVRLGGC